MNKKTKTSSPRSIAPDARSVFVAGTFNGWTPDEIPLQRDEAGQWSTVLDLPPDHYEFKFIVDGQWCCEPGCEDKHRSCPNCVPNEHGTMNRVIEVA